MNTFKIIVDGAARAAPYYVLNTFKFMPPGKTTPKAEEASLSILDAALAIFRQELPLTSSIELFGIAA